jgi:hypothetical protein
VRSNRESRPSTPRWVKVSVVIAIIMILLFVILHLTGNSFGGHGAHLPQSSIITYGLLQP